MTSSRTDARADGGSTISRGTGITIGLLASILGVATYGTWQVGSWVGRVESRLEAIEAAIGNLNDQHLHWSTFEFWLYRLENQNPALTIPPIRKEK